MEVNELPLVARCLQVRSRLHVVFVLRPYTPLDQAPAVAESPTGGAPPKPRSMLHRILFGRPRSRDTTAGSAFPDISSLSSWTGKYLLGECHEQMCRPEPKPSSVQSIDLGDGALRHEMVIVKQSGFICLDYKGVLYRIVRTPGPLPARHTYAHPALPPPSRALWDLAACPVSAGEGLKYMPFPP